VDTDLIGRAQHGDEEAFASLAVGVGDRLHAVAFRILRDTALAEDASQQALLTIWRDLPQLRDPARFDTWSYRLGPTVDDFANALADNPNLEVTTPAAVALAGYSGKSVDLQVPSDISRCETSYFVWEPGIYAQGPGQRWHLWILDVEGVRVVVQSTDYAGTSPQHRAELQAIVDSIQIEP